METIIIIALVLMILGILGSIMPIMPGSIFSFIGLVLLYFGKPDSISIFSLAIFGTIMVILIIADYIAPILGAKFSGASKSGLIGSILGCLVGIVFFPPIGMFIGAFIGAVIGEMADGKKSMSAVKAGVGTLVGSVFMIILQTVFSAFAAIYFFIKLV
ncbi:MAG: DUF456 domain-containing protein [Parcubacteria group bacterium]|jgi:hypothetical protein